VGYDPSGQIEPLFKSIIFHYRALTRPWAGGAAL